MTQPNPASPTSLLSHPVDIARVNARKVIRFDLMPDAASRARIADDLGLDRLRKLRFEGQLRPLGKKDWELQARLGATVVQPCAVTLEPVTTRIDEEVLRRFLTEMPEPEGLEVEMPEDDTAEPLGAIIDPGAIALEALALALPAFPRAAGAVLAEDGLVTAAPKGAEPINDQPKKPFAGLADLRARLAGGKDDAGE